MLGYSYDRVYKIKSNGDHEILNVKLTPLPNNN